MALPTKPSALSPPYDNVDWVSGGTPGTDLIKPTEQISPGWGLNQVIPYPRFNWILRAFSLWSKYFEAWTDQVMDQSDDTKGTAVIGNAPYAGLNHLPMSAGTLRDQLITFCGTLYAHFAGTANKHSADAINFVPGTTTYLASTTKVGDDPLSPGAGALQTLDTALNLHNTVETTTYEMRVSAMEAVAEDASVTAPKLDGYVRGGSNAPGFPVMYTSGNSMFVVYPLASLPIGARVLSWKLYAKTYGTISVGLFKRGSFGTEPAPNDSTAIGEGIIAYNSASGNSDWPGNVKREAGVNTVYSGPYTDATVSAVSSGARTVASGEDWFVVASDSAGGTTSWGPLVVSYVAPKHSK